MSHKRATPSLGGPHRRPCHPNRGDARRRSRRDGCRGRARVPSRPRADPSCRHGHGVGGPARVEAAPQLVDDTHTIEGLEVHCLCARARANV